MKVPSAFTLTAAPPVLLLSADVTKLPMPSVSLASRSACGARLASLPVPSSFTLAVEASSTAFTGTTSLSPMVALTSAIGRVVG